MVQMDHVKMCKSRRGNRQVLVIIDHFTKYAEAVPCNPNELTAEATVGKILNALVFSTRDSIHRYNRDNGPQFVAEMTRALMRVWQTTQAHSTAHHPATNRLGRKIKQDSDKYAECL